MHRRLTVHAALIAAALAASLVTSAISTTPAHADYPQPRVVSTNPVNWTPNVLDGDVRAVAVVGNAVVVGGDFHRISDSGMDRQGQRPYLFAYNRSTGAVLPFAPALDGPVYALATGPDGTVYVGGMFRYVNGYARRGVARLRVSDGALNTDFSATITDGDVRTLVARGGEVYLGGSFRGVNGYARTALARVDGRTGALDRGFNLHLAAPELSRTKVEDMALSPDGNHLVVIGALSRANGWIRAQLAMINTGVRPAELSSWYTDAYAGACRAGFDTYLRGVDFAPSGTYFVAVTTGRLSGKDRMCDTAARFEVRGGGAHWPTWVNHTGGDSLYSVSVTGSAVYVGGHQRWMNNPYGSEFAGPGAVARPGIAALDPHTGRALPWNPTRSRGVGVRALVATPEGLIIGSDTDRLGHEYHARIGMFPLR
jgi:hypothetical protein